MLKYDRSAVSELNSNVYKNVKQVGNTLKPSEIVWQNNQIITCCIKSFLVRNDYDWKTMIGPIFRAVLDFSDVYLGWEMTNNSAEFNQLDY